MVQVLQELLHAVLITAFVWVMMAVIELLTVATHGRLAPVLRGRTGAQYLLGSFLGATPGCAGAYLSVSMYAQGAFTFGATTAALLATTGDEAFLMIALFPLRALLLFAGLFVLGATAGLLVDGLVCRLYRTRGSDCRLAEVHAEDMGPAAGGERWWPPRLRPLWPRVPLLAILGALVVVLLSGGLAHHADLHHTAEAIGAGGIGIEGGVFVVALLVGVVLVLLAPPHYLAEHLWHHLALHHVPRLFAWTAGTLVAVTLLAGGGRLSTLLAGHGGWLLVGAALLGLIPQSGPHLVVVTLFATGQVPLSVLLANSIVQDGHGLLPLLGLSVSDAVVVKLVKLVIALALAGALMAAGY